MIDEYPYLIPDRAGHGGVRGFLEVLGALKTLHQEGWLLVLPCGRSAAISRQASWGTKENPFVGLLHARFLGPLSRDENDELMVTLGRSAGLEFTPDALERVYRETAGHPMFSRSLGSILVRRGKGEVDADEVCGAVEALLEDRDQRVILAAIYEERLDDDEREIVRHLATEGPLPRKALFPEDANRKERIRLRDAIGNLIDTSVLEQLPSKEIDIRYGLLRGFVANEDEELGY